MRPGLHTGEGGAPTRELPANQLFSPTGRAELRKIREMTRKVAAAGRGDCEEGARSVPPAGKEVSLCCLSQSQARAQETWVPSQPAIRSGVGRNRPPTHTPSQQMATRHMSWCRVDLGCLGMSAGQHTWGPHRTR